MTWGEIMKTYVCKYTKTVYGIMTVEAESLEKAEQGDFDIIDENDNTCDYLFGEWEEKEGVEDGKKHKRIH